MTIRPIFGEGPRNYRGRRVESKVCNLILMDKYTDRGVRSGLLRHKQVKT